MQRLLLESMAFCNSDCNSEMIYLIVKRKQVLQMLGHVTLKLQKKHHLQLTTTGLKPANNRMQDSKRSLTCHSGNCLLNCSVPIHAGHPEEFSPCLHCGWRMMMGRAPALRFSHCHCHCYCHCRSSATPPRNLLGKPDIISLKAVKLKPRQVYQLHTEKGP